MQYHAIPRPLFWPCHVFGATYWAEAPNTETPSGPNTAYLPVPPGFFWRAACRHGHSCLIVKLRFLQCELEIFRLLDN
jgi:hypothetical protein